MLIFPQKNESPRTEGITLSNNLSGLCSIKNKIKYWSPKIWPLALSKKLFVQKKVVLMPFIFID